jgi:beta-1,2-mannobiose phosphorylase / 1,2-beta-oligomannan phosphorylase
MRYSAGIVVHDSERPHIVHYRSPSPILAPETIDETVGVVNNVVFPTGIDWGPGAPERSYDVYYGMADARIGRVRVTLGASELGEREAEESAA